MKICNILLIILIGTAKADDDFSEDLSLAHLKNVPQTAMNTMHPNIVNPEIVPAYLSNAVDSGSNVGKCVVDCNSLNTQCPSFCSQYPQLCNQNCRQTSRKVKVKVPVQVAKRVPEKVTKTVRKETKLTKVPKEFDTVRNCPRLYKMIEDEDDNERCIEDRERTIRCSDGYELKNNSCIRITTVCANEYDSVSQNCTLRLVCPLNYIQKGRNCVPPDPQCPFGWHWNGGACEPKRVTCPFGFVLSPNNECIHEEQKCPTNYREAGGSCIKEDPVCPFGFFLDMNRNICEKSVEKCPPGSNEQHNECVILSSSCPAGSTESGNFCSYEQTVYKTVYEVKYVEQTVSIPGPVTCGEEITGTTEGYACQTSCVNNCVRPQQ